MLLAEIASQSEYSIECESFVDISLARSYENAIFGKNHKSSLMFTYNFPQTQPVNNSNESPCSTEGFYTKTNHVS